MAESGLSVSYVEIRRAIGRFLGYGASPSGWTADQTAEVDDHIKAGLRRFYGAHQWSFLRPQHTIATVAAQAEYQLPDNFAAILGSPTGAAGEGHPWQVELVPALAMRRMRLTARSGRPFAAAVSPLVSDGQTGQRKVLTLYPTPDAAYDLLFDMQIIPETLTSSVPYPLGGEQYAEAILETCLAAAESTMDDAQRVHAQLAADLLALAIRTDNTHRSIERLGYNGDPSVRGDGLPTGRRRSIASSVTYNNTEY